MSFMKRSSFICAVKSPRTIMGPRTLSMAEVAALVVSTSSAMSRSRPALRASVRASAAAALWSATRRLATSLSVIACPARPTWTTRGNADSSTGRHRSKRARSPPTMKLPSPRSIMEVVPLTGQSRNSIPLPVTSRARRSVRVGEIVLIWMTVRPGRPPETMPSLPRMADSAAASEGRSVQTASAVRATAADEAAAFPPIAVSAATRSGRMSKPTTAWPALTKRAAMEEPRRPSPTMPTVVMSALRAGRVVPRVDGVLQKFLGLEGPKLGDVGKGVDHGVLELAAHALDLPHVDVFDRVAVVVEAHRPTGGFGEIHAAHRGEKLLAVLDVATRGLEGCLESQAAYVAALGVVRRHLLVLRLVGLGEFSVRGRGEGGGVVQRGDDAQHLIAHGAEHVLVGEGPAADQRQLALEARLRVLLGEAERVGAREDAVDSVDIPAQLGQVGREIGGIERGPELLDDLAAGVLEGALEAARHLPAEGEVVADHRDLAVAQIVVDPLAERLGGLRARPAGADDVRAALALGDVLRGHDRKNGGHFLVVHVAGDGIAHGGGERSYQHVDALALHEASRLGETRRRLALVVLGDQLDLAARQLPAVLFEEELHAVGHVLAVRGEGARLGQDEPDLDGSLLRPAHGGHTQEESGNEHQRKRECLVHERLLIGLEAGLYPPSAWRISSLPSGQPMAAAISRNAKPCISS